jgi:hypothetical protein
MIQVLLEVLAQQAGQTIKKAELYKEALEKKIQQECILEAVRYVLHACELVGL